ncbi:MAG: zinc ribbon domain-containing protein [Nitrospirae bacterium]|nr:zinc ribbon domain-containing protein [Nitrospirota bacterium]
MPIYEYECLDCKKKFALFQKVGTTESETSCLECHSKNVKKLISGFSCSVSAGSGERGPVSSATSHSGSM